MGLLLSSLLPLVSGLLFGFGLLVAGMTNPAKVQAFLDLAGAWDPSLAFVMAAAVAVALPAFRWARRRPRAWSGAPLQLDLPTRIDTRLLAGAALFGVGWGASGFCPGPAVVALATGGDAGVAALFFVPAMLAGMALHDRVVAGPRGPLEAQS